MMGGTDQLLERVLEVLRQVQPVPRIHIQFETLQDAGQIFRDLAFFVL